MNLKNSTQRIEPHNTTHQQIRKQSQTEVTEADAEPEADQEEADQMRDTEVGSAAATTPTTQNIQEIPDWAEMTRGQRKKWKKWGGRRR